jgi:tetratricopeptide (TPR) repeat protein
VKASRRFARGLVLALPLALASACSSGNQRGAQAPVAELRKAGSDSDDGEVVARWLLGELVSPGGGAAHALKARKRLDEVRGAGLLPSLARALDDSMHGRLRGVSERYLEVLTYARDSADPRANVFAWYAAHEAVAFRHAAPGLWKRLGPKVEALLDRPGNIGWRARLELGQWWADETRALAVKDAEKQAAARLGCVSKMRLAGPFGRNTARDTLRAFPPEKESVWPERWPLEPDQGEAPRVLETQSEGCVISADEPVAEGIVYGETFLDVEQRTELLLVPQGAFALWVDGALVTERAVREWGSWLNLGVKLELLPGRHRFVVKLGGATGSLRILYPDGRPYPKAADIELGRPHVLVPPSGVTPHNPLDRWVHDGKAFDPKDDLVRFFGSYLAGVDDQEDVSSVLIEPLISDADHATGPSLSTAALFAANDPIFSEDQQRDLARVLEERAENKDKKLWRPRLSIALSLTERSGPTEAVRALEALGTEFPEVPAVLGQLGNLYAELGWANEHARVVEELARRFPDDPTALEQAVQIYDERGNPARADELVARIKTLDPDSELPLVRALERADYKAALAELKRLGERRPDRKDIAERLYDVLVRAGNQGETLKKLEAAIEKSPKEEEPRLSLADAHYAAGNRRALVQAIVDALAHGAPTGRLEAAIDLVDGATELEPYRMNSEAVISEYERSGLELDGTAARVLDYAAVWVHTDGSSRMLEHEIVRVQSAEAITDMAEEPIRQGIYLKLRVVKKDGRVLEPELVSGKPTVTMPHLEVGDYIETERIESMPGDGRRGQRFIGPRWFFREENVAYARSEFVVISPKDRPLQIETHNDVPKPVVEEKNDLVIRRFRVDRSPAAPVEPFSAPIVEFLPSVQIGWGLSLDATLRAMSDAADALTPEDPRIVRIAERIVKGVPASSVEERARRVYRWVVSNVENGEEVDGRRAIISRNGNMWRAYITLCEALDIPVDYAVVQNRLTLPAQGPFTESVRYTQPLLRVRGEKQPLWLMLGSKHAPFGYVPAEARGMPAVVLGGDEWEKTTTPASGALDDAVTEGKASLAADGSAELELTQSYHGKYAAALRSVFTELPAPQIRDAIESRLLGPSLRGVELLKHEIRGVEDPDAPIVIVTTSKVRGFAQAIGSTLVIQPPFGPRLSSFATLPTRQTPLLIVDAMSQRVKLEIALPKGAGPQGALAKGEIRDGERSVVLSDSAKPGSLILDRRVSLPAGRVQTKEYPTFLAFTRRADEALSGSVRVQLR